MNSEIIYLEISFTSNPKRMELLVRNLYKISPVTKNKANRQNQKISNRQAHAVDVCLLQQPEGRVRVPR